MKKSIKIILFLFATTSLFSLDIEYKTNNKERLFSTIKQINSSVHNRGMVSKYEKKKEENCDIGWKEVENGIYCKKKKEIKYSTIGNMVVINNNDSGTNSRSRLKFKVYYNGYTPNIAPSIPSVTVNLQEKINFKLEPFKSGDLACKREKREYPKRGKNLPRNAFLKYFIIDIPKYDNNIEKILKDKFKCKFMGNIVNKKISTKTHTDHFLKQISINETASNKYNTKGLENIDYGLEWIVPKTGSIKAKVFFPDEKNDSKPTVIKYSEIDLKLSKTFFYPKGVLSDNEFKTNFNSGETKLVYRTTEYSKLNEGSAFTEEGNLNTRVFKSLIKCKDEMIKNDKILNNKSKKTTYKMILNYGNILTKYDTTEPLNIFDHILLNKYIKNKFNLKPQLYTNFKNKINYSILLQRDDARLGNQEFSTEKKDVIYPTILPYIVSENYNTSCSKISEKVILNDFVKASLIIRKNSTSNITEKYIGLASKSYIKGLSTSQDPSDILIKKIEADFKKKIDEIKIKVNNYIDYSYKNGTNGGSIVKMARGGIEVDVYKYKEDIFKQFIEGSKLKSELYKREIKYTPVIVKLRHYNCN